MDSLEDTEFETSKANKESKRVEVFSSSSSSFVNDIQRRRPSERQQQQQPRSSPPSSSPSSSRSSSPNDLDFLGAIVINTTNAGTNSGTG